MILVMPTFQTVERIPGESGKLCKAKLLNSFILITFFDNYKKTNQEEENKKIEKVSNYTTRRWWKDMKICIDKPKRKVSLTSAER